MNRSALYTALFISVALSACGGGGGSNSSNASVAMPTYTYVAPQAAAQQVYADTLLDNLNNTVNRTLAVTVTAASAGGYTATRVDPSHDRVVSGVVDHTFYPTTVNYDAMGRDMNWVVTGASGNPVQCQVTGGQAPGAPSPLTAGQAWTAAYAEVCGAGPGLAYTQIGTFVGIESVTVPAGTFNAYKFVSTTTWTENGRTTTQSISRWRDAAASASRVLKSVATFSYSGTAPPQGALVSETQLLQSFH